MRTRKWVWLLVLAALVWVGCEQPGNPGTAGQPDGNSTDDWSEWDDGTGETLYMTGIEIASPPDKTLYPLSFTPDDLDLAGLVVNAVYENGAVEPLAAEQYTIDKKELTAGSGTKRVFVEKTVVKVTETEKTREITVGGDTFTETYVEVTTKNVQARVNFLVTVATTNRVLASVSLDKNPPSAQTLGAAFSMSGVTITGNYTDGTSETLQSSLCKVTGYDMRKREPQTVTIKVNGITLKTADNTEQFDVTTKIPASATVKPITFAHTFIPGQTLGYRQVYVKNEAFTAAGSGLAVQVETGGKTILLSYESGGLTKDDVITDTTPVTAYTPVPTSRESALSGTTQTLTLDAKGMRQLNLALDNGKKAEFKVYVADTVPQVWFDYGFRRTEDDPTGKGPSGGKYYVKKNKTVTLAPVRYLIGYTAGHEEAPETTYSWSVQGGAYSGGTEKNAETFTFTPSATGTYTVNVSVTGRNFVTGATDTKTATTEVVCFEGTVSNSGGQQLTRPLKDFAPGQFTEQGTGYGWSLGAALGYEVWDAGPGTSSVSITGNGFETWNEPGVVWTQADDNGNNIPDEVWVEYQGSDDTNAAYKNKILRRHAITYFRASFGTEKPNQYGQITRTVCWIDGRGRMGVIAGGWPSDTGQTEKGIHSAEGSDWIAFTGTLLRNGGGANINDGTLNSGGKGISGYVDVYSTQTGQTLVVGAARFVKVQTAYFNYGGGVGEHSTEIVSATGLSDQSGGFANPLGN